MMNYSLLAVTNAQLLTILIIVLCVLTVIVTALGIVFIFALKQKRAPVVKVVMAPPGDKKTVQSEYEQNEIIEERVARLVADQLAEDRAKREAEEAVKRVAEAEQAAKHASEIAALYEDAAKKASELSALLFEGSKEEPLEEAENYGQEDEAEDFGQEDEAEDFEQEDEELETAKQVAVSEMSETAKTALGISDETPSDKRFEIRVSYSFLAKLILSPEEVKNRYVELSNEIACYKKVKTSLSRRQERVYKGRENLAYMLFKGKKLCIAFALDPSEYEGTKYRGVDVGGVKRFVNTPMLVKLSSPRKVVYAKYLLSRLAEKYSLEKGEPSRVLTGVEEATRDELIRRGEIRIKGELLDKSQAETAAASAATAELMQEIAEPEVLPERDFQILEEVDAESVPEVITDEKAKELVEEKFVKKTGNTVKKRGVVNIDSLSRNFESGERVTIERLQEKGIIPKDVTVIKVLAKGVLNKPLIVEADDFSLEAVKMIALTGGRVIHRNVN